MRKENSVSAPIYLRSRLGQVNEAMKKAYLSGKRIFVLVTSELDFVKELLSQESVLGTRRIAVNDPETNTMEIIRPGLQLCSFGFIPSTPRQVICNAPKVFLYVSEAQQANGQRVYSFPEEELVNYARFFFGIYEDEEDAPAESLDNLRKSIIVIVSPEPTNSIPPYALPLTETIEVPFLAEDEFKHVVSEWIAEHEGAKLISCKSGYRLIEDGTYLDRLYQAMRGMSPLQITECLAKNKDELGSVWFARGSKELKTLLKNIRRETESIISQSSALSLIDTTGAENEEPAGLANITNWIRENKERICTTKVDEEKQIPPCNGILVSGIPGTGKSMLAKYIAAEVNLTLIRLNMDAALGKYVGDSEKGVRTALNVAEALSPCVLWIDEIEKAFEGGHEVTRRIIGMLLTWMQEKAGRGKSCFVFATANDISKMPPEMFRTGRFDEKFYTFLPSADECGEIFGKTIKAQNEKHRRALDQKGRGKVKMLFDESKIDARMFVSLLNSDICQPTDIYQNKGEVLPRNNKFFIGSDIAQIISNAKCAYFSRSYAKGEDFVFSSAEFKECLKEAIKGLRSYGETNLEQIALCYSQLATNNFTPASTTVLLPFSGYDEWGYKRSVKTKGKEAVLYKAVGGSVFSNRYDNQLFQTISRALNDMAEEIIQNKRRP